MLISYGRALHNFKTTEWTPKEEMNFTITIYYTIISKNSKIRQKFKNNPIVKKSTSQVGDIILNTCMKFESYPTKTVGEDRFWKKV